MKIYLSGIGGIGMSAYARYMHAAGHTVIGSDSIKSETTQSLLSEGIDVIFEQDGSHVIVDIDLFVYSEAIPNESPERKAAEKLGIKQLSYFQALGEMTQGTNLIAVCGTHGKSTTTAMAGRMLIETEQDPSIIVGTKMFELDGKNWRKGSNDLFVAEACEYRGSFLSLKPKIILVTNIDWDHIDSFPSQESYDDIFRRFFSETPADTAIVFHGSDAKVKKIVEESGKKYSDADGMADITLKVSGRHMRENAQLVLALAQVLNIDEQKARKALADYQGSWRRMENKGTTMEGAIVIDDYAHHPKEIIATIQGVKEKYPQQRLVCVFQPHTHDRTLKLWDDFAKAFLGAGAVILTDVYDARPDRESEEVDLDLFVNAICDQSKVEAINGGSLDDVEQNLHTILKKDDILLVMGAGIVTNLATSIAQ